MMQLLLRLCAILYSLGAGMQCHCGSTPNWDILARTRAIQTICDHWLCHTTCGYDMLPLMFTNLISQDFLGTPWFSIRLNLTLGFLESLFAEPANRDFWKFLQPYASWSQCLYRPWLQTAPQKPWPDHYLISLSTRLEYLGGFLIPFQVGSTFSGLGGQPI